MCWALAALVMAFKLPVRLQVLIPAVENAIAGNAYRPGDVIKTRAGLHIEIGNTDAEGRVILCDALAYAAEQAPELLIDMATLTGAARVALGGQLPALFSNRFDTARELVDLGLKLDDPLWHMPLWHPYRAGIESSIGDIVNTGKSPAGGAINAALFLDPFGLSLSKPGALLSSPPVPPGRRVTFWRPRKSPKKTYPLVQGCTELGASASLRSRRERLFGTPRSIVLARNREVVRLLGPAALETESPVKP
jgi:hypothetical protein